MLWVWVIYLTMTSLYRRSPWVWQDTRQSKTVAEESRGAWDDLHYLRYDMEQIGVLQTMHGYSNPKNTDYNGMIKGTRLVRRYKYLDGVWTFELRTSISLGRHGRGRQES